MTKKFPVSKILAGYSIIVFIMYAYGLYSLAVAERAVNGTHIYSPVGVDYSMFYAAGTTAAGGEAKEIYNVGRQQDMMAGYLKIDRVPDDIQLFYPPTVLLFVMTVFSRLPFFISLMLWLITTLAFAVFAAYKLLPKHKELALLMISFPSVMHNFRWGQNSFFSTALLGLGLAFMKERPVLSGLMFGLLTYKPQLACFPFLVLLVTREWKVLFWSIAFTLLTVAASLLSFGTEVWIAFLQRFFNQSSSLLSSFWENTHAIQPTLYSSLRLLGIDAAGIAMKIILLAAGAVATYIVMRVWKLSERINLRGAAIVLATFMFMPYFVQYDLMLLSIPFILLVNDFITYGCEKFELITCILLWIMPLTNMALVRNTGFQISPFVVAIMLFAVFDRAGWNKQITKELA